MSGNQVLGCNVIEHGVRNMIIICSTIESIASFIQPDHPIWFTGIFIDHYKDCPVKSSYSSRIGCIYDCHIAVFVEVGSHIENDLPIEVIDSISIESGLVDSIAIELQAEVWITGMNSKYMTGRVLLLLQLHLQEWADRYLSSVQS